MSTVFAFVVGFVLLALVGRSVLTAYRTMQIEIDGTGSRQVWAIVISVITAFVAIVIMLRLTDRS